MPNSKNKGLLTREEFKTAVFKRDGNKCVYCKGHAVDAHHILERRLFPDGGYVIDNGSSLCSSCHFKAEQTLISCDDIRRLANIKIVVLPPNLDSELDYDKWANIIRPDGSRKPGPLFLEEGVQKILKPILYLFRD